MRLWTYLLPRKAASPSMVSVLSCMTSHASSNRAPKTTPPARMVRSAKSVKTPPEELSMRIRSSGFLAA